MFSICFHYRSLDIKRVLSLANVIYNNRAHRGLHNLSPSKVHNCPHSASLIARLNDLTLRKRELSSMETYRKTKPSERLEIGNKVKVRISRHIFRKTNPLRQSIWSKNDYVIKDIDMSKFPPLYELHGLLKRYYAFQLLPLSNFYPLDTSKNRPAILVNNFRIPEDNYLRSGKDSSRKIAPLYQILKDGKVYEVTKDDLEFYKKTLGKNSISYSSYFNDHPDVIV